MGLVCAALFAFLVGSVAFYLMLVIGVLAYDQLQTARDRMQAQSVRGRSEFLIEWLPGKLKNKPRFRGLFFGG